MGHPYEIPWGLFGECVNTSVQKRLGSVIDGDIEFAPYRVASAVSEFDIDVPDYWSIRPCLELIGEQ